MTKKTSVFSKIIFALTLAFAICGTAIRTYMMKTAYDAPNGFFTNSTLNDILGYSLAALAVLFAVSAYIYIKEENCSILPAAGVLVKGASLFSGCVLGGLFIYSFAKAVIPSLGGMGGSDLAAMLFSVVAMLYFFTLNKTANFRSLLCLANALVLLTIVLDLYFGKQVSYVNHSVMLCFAAAIFTSLSFAAEANFALSRPAYRRYLAYAPSAVILSLTLSVSDIVYFATNRTAVLTDIYYDVIILVFGLYHLARLIEIAIKKELK